MIKAKMWNKHERGNNCIIIGASIYLKKTFNRKPQLNTRICLVLPSNFMLFHQPWQLIFIPTMNYKLLTNNLCLIPIKLMIQMKCFQTFTFFTYRVKSFLNLHFWFSFSLSRFLNGVHAVDFLHVGLILDRFSRV